MAALSTAGLLALAAGGSILNSAMSFGSAAYNQHNAKELLEMQQAFNAAEAEKARTFSAEQASLLRDFNANQAQLSRDFNSAEALKSREWSEMMSNTSYQRAMKDLKAAGLNPVLAAGMGGASAGTPVAASSGAAFGSMPSSATASSGGASPGRADFSHIADGLIDFAITSALKLNSFASSTKSIGFGR